MPQYAYNKKGAFNYHIHETFEAGIQLTGAEVKSVKAKQLELVGSYVSLRDNGLWLVGGHITKYRHAARESNEDPDRTRKLLVKKSELKTLIGKMTSEGLTLIPLSLYSKGSFVKVEVALARGKKKADKRESIRKKEADRRMRSKMFRRR